MGCGGQGTKGGRPRTNVRETVLTPELSARHSGTEGRGGCRDKVGVAVGPEEAGRRGGVPVPEGVLGHSAALPGESRGSSDGEG